MERNGSERGGTLESGGSIDGVVAVEIDQGCGERGGSVGTNGGAGDGSESGGGVFGVDFGGRETGWVGSDIAEGVTQIVDGVGDDEGHVFSPANSIAAGEAHADFP